MSCLGSIQVVFTFFGKLSIQKGIEDDLSIHEGFPASISYGDKENELAVCGSKKVFIFCKILVLGFASDLAGGWIAIDTEKTDQGSGHVRSPVMATANPRVAVTEKDCDLSGADQEAPSSTFPQWQEGRRPEPGEWVGFFVHREMCKNAYFVSL